MSTDAKKTRTGRIYQLVNMITNEKYVGATFQPLYKRQYNRKNMYNRWLKGKGVVSQNHKLFNNIKQYGFNNFRIELLSEVEVKNRGELNKLEGDYIRKLDTYNNGLNGQIPNRDSKQRYQDNKDIKKQHYQNNKDNILHQQKQYYNDNKDKILNDKKQYYQNNKDKILNYQKQYQQVNKDKILKRHKQYYQKNKDKLSQYYKKYQQTNKDKLLKYHKQYREKNKDKLLNQQKKCREKNNNKYECKICNFNTYFKTNYTNHLNSQKHKFNVMY